MIGQTFNLLSSMYEAVGFGFVLALALPAFIALLVVILRAAVSRERARDTAGD